MYPIIIISYCNGVAKKIKEESHLKVPMINTSAVTIINGTYKLLKELPCFIFLQPSSRYLLKKNICIRQFGNIGVSQ